MAFVFSSLAACSIVAASLSPSPPTAATREALDINPFLPANPRDEFDAALFRLARGAIAADLSSNEPWLFDRPTVFYKLSRWSGDAALRKHAFDLVERYYAQIDARGRFALKSGDAKYSYIDGAVWYEHATGDQRFRPKAAAIYDLWLGELAVHYSSSQHFWTERHIAYSLAAALGWYELTGKPEAMARARDMIQQWTAMSAETGAPLHTLAQHQEAFEPPYGPKRMTSPWMSALFFEQVKTYYRLTGDRSTLQMIAAYADFLLANCLYDGSANHPNLKGYLMPYYLCGENRSYYDRETPSESDGEHTPDVMGLFAFAVYAKKQLGQDSRTASETYRELRRSAAFFVGRRADVQPPRKINWWAGSTYDATWLTQ